VSQSRNKDAGLLALRGVVWGSFRIGGNKFLTASQFHSTGGEGSPFLVSNVSKGYFTLLFGTDKVMYENSKWAQIADVAKKSPPPHARQFPF